MLWKEPDDSTSCWSNTDAEPKFVHSLQQLYFHKVHTVYPLFSQPHFHSSYYATNGQFCSSSLVEAICIMACLIHPPTTYPSDVDVARARHKFRTSLEPTISSLDTTSVTDVQALAVMFLVERQLGSMQTASYYLDAASRALPRVPVSSDEEYLHVLQYTAAGLLNLNTMMLIDSVSDPVPAIEVAEHAPIEYEEQIFRKLHSRELVHGQKRVIYPESLRVTSSKGALLRRLNLTEEIYKLMLEETMEVFRWLISHKRHFKRKSQKGPRYSLRDFRGWAQLEAMELLGQGGSEHTSRFWRLAYVNPASRNWIAQWFLYHKIRRYNVICNCYALNRGMCSQHPASYPEKLRAPNRVPPSANESETIYQEIAPCNSVQKKKSEIVVKHDSVGC